VKIGLQLGRAQRGRAEWIELDVEVTIVADGLCERGGAGDLAEVGRVGRRTGNGGACGGRYRCAGERARELEELAPGLVN
jgi:hypothetical protein